MATSQTPGDASAPPSADRWIGDRFRAVFDGLSDAVVIADANGTVLDANAAASALLSYAHRELRGRTVHDLIAVPPDQTTAHAAALPRDGGWSGELELRRRDGSVVAVEARVSRIALETGEVQAAILRDISARRASELERQRLVAAEQAAQAEAQAARQTRRFLAEATALLAASLDTVETLRRVVALAVPTMADGCVIDLVMEDGSVQRVAVAHEDPDHSRTTFEIDRRTPLSLAAPAGPGKVIRTGETEIAEEITDADLVASARSEEHLWHLRARGIRSQIVAPLMSRGQILGALTFAYYAASGRRYTPADVPLASEIARYAGVALDNARLYEQARAAEASSRRMSARVQALAEASRAFAEATLDAQAVVEVVVRQVSQIIGDACVVRLLSADGAWLLPVAHHHGDPETLAMLEGLLVPVGVGEGGDLLRGVLHTGAGVRVAVTSIDALRAMVRPEIWPYIDRFGTASVVIVPMRAQGRVIGLLTSSTDRSRYIHSEDDQTFLQDLADRAALAVSNARLYDDERAARTDAEAANRAKDEFLSVLSHEMRTPLTSILGWARLLRTRTLDADTVARGLEAMEQSARTQAQLVEDMLDVSRIVTGKLRLDMQPLTLAPVIDAAVQTLAPAAEAKSIRMAVEVDPTVGPVRGDHDRLQQVVWNLLANAVKFTPSGGTVTVRLAERHGMAEIIVQDTGAGISPQFLPHAFDRFRQADPSSTRRHGGLGLGLAIVRHLVELHGGYVRAESDGEDRGATFTVCLPRAPHRAVPADSARSHRAGTGSGLRLTAVSVLLVEDEAATREMLRVALETEGARVRSCASAAEGLTALSEQPPDVLLSDIAMPEQDGYSLLTHIRALAADRGGAIPAIALTAYVAPEAANRARAVGFDRYIAKPIDPDALIEAVVDVMRET